MSFNDALKLPQLIKAAYMCAVGVRWKQTTQDYLTNVLIRSIKLRNDVLSGQYKIQKYTKFSIHCPKHRIIYSTKFRDRVLQKSICNNRFILAINKTV